jgi:hypothetical protein
MTANFRRFGDSVAVCLLSALAFHGLTDEIPKKVWLLVPENKHSAHRDIRLLRSRNPHWKMGIDAQNGYRITNRRAYNEANCQSPKDGHQPRRRPQGNELP